MADMSGMGRMGMPGMF